MANASASLAILHFLPFPFCQFGIEGEQKNLFPLQRGSQAPIFFGDEILDLPLSLANNPNGNRLNPTRTQPPSYLLPKDRADLITHQAIQNSPCLLCFVFRLL